VLQPEELAKTAAVVVVEMGDADGVVVIPFRFREVAPEFGREIAAQVFLVGCAAHVGVVDQYLAPVGQIEAQRVGIAEGEKVNFCNHLNNLHWLRPQANLLLSISTWHT
jgi:hypothetical protein